MHRDDQDFTVIHPCSFVPIDGSSPTQLHPAPTISASNTRPIPQTILDALLLEEARVRKETTR